MKNHKGNAVFFFLILLILGLSVWLIRTPASSAEDYAYSDIYDLLEQEKVDSLTLREMT